MDKEFRVECVERTQPYYIPAWVEIVYDDGMVRTVARLDVNQARRLSDKLLQAVKSAEDRHAATSSEQWVGFRRAGDGE